MNKHRLHSDIKPIGTVYMYWLFFGIHYAYFGKWGLQLLYWATLGGLGIWAISDFLTMPEKIVKHREAIFQKIDEMEKYENLAKHKKIKFKPATGVKSSLAG